MIVNMYPSFFLSFLPAMEWSASAVGSSFHEWRTFPSFYFDRFVFDKPLLLTASMKIFPDCQQSKSFGGSHSSSRQTENKNLVFFR
ncbi:hypothetical protein [uncultured Dysosmobacter sp.]|uniref:hypothetical protein n=1 Tax=uncultured Dysosmobacter sp. TaxID=2591384 RepID=UPI002635F942|nr:hypothetical protein [uncultured Dysosmobacter sp.]